MPGVQWREPDFPAMIRLSFARPQHSRRGRGATTPYRRRICAPESLLGLEPSRSETASRAGEYRRYSNDTISGGARFDQRRCNGLAVVHQRRNPDEVCGKFVTRVGEHSMIGWQLRRVNPYTGGCVVRGSSRLHETPARSGRISARHAPRVCSDPLSGFAETGARQLPGCARQWREREAGRRLPQPCVASGCNGVEDGDKFRTSRTNGTQPLPH